MISLFSVSNVNQTHAYSKEEGAEMEKRIHKNLREEFLLCNHADGCSLIHKVAEKEICKN